ncbi:MAG: hypothetical protein KF742_02520 [Cryobacterium sp.]|nr:hypothetical protein [Cryobacterium sp.]
MGKSGDDFRRKAAEAQELANEVKQLVLQVDELNRVYKRVNSAIVDLVGGTSTAEDQKMLGIIGTAEMGSRKATLAGQAAISSAGALAREFEIKAREADHREEEARAAAERNSRK